MSERANVPRRQQMQMYDVGDRLKDVAFTNISRDDLRNLLLEVKDMHAALHRIWQGKAPE